MCLTSDGDIGRCVYMRLVSVSHFVFSLSSVDGIATSEGTSLTIT